MLYHRLSKQKTGKNRHRITAFYFLKFTFILSYFLLWQDMHVKAQNHILNPGFETMAAGATCAQIQVFANFGIPQIQSVCASWTAGSAASPDYFNDCATGACPTWNNACRTSIQNFAGIEAPHAGESYGGFVSGTNGGAVACEYLIGNIDPAIAPAGLVAGTSYRIQFWVSLAEASDRGVLGVGARCYQSSSTPGIPMAGVGMYDPTTLGAASIRDLTYITNKNGWTQVSGTFTATGGEDRILIGYFPATTGVLDATPSAAPSANCHPQPASGTLHYAYYYVDDVSLTPEGCNCNSYTPTFSPDVACSDSTRCCWKFGLGIGTDGCNVSAIKLSWINPSTLQPEDILPITTFNGGPVIAGTQRNNLVSFCVDKFTGTQNVTITYYNASNQVICTRQATITCYCGCNDHNPSGHPKWFVFTKKILTGPDSCCFDLFLDNPNECTYYLGRGLMFDYFNSGAPPYDPTYNIVSVSDGDWKATKVNGGQIFFEGPAGSNNQILSGGRIYLGKFCVPPSNVQGQADYRVKWGSTPSSIYSGCTDESINTNCNTPPDACCTSLHANLQFVSNSDSRCPGGNVFKIMVSQFPQACNVHTVTISAVGTNMGATVLSQPLATYFINPIPMGFGISAGEVCLGPALGNPACYKIIVRFYDVDGKILCVKEISTSCGSGGGGGGIGSAKWSPDKNGQSLINAETSNSMLTLQPNPATNKVTINYRTLEQGKNRIELLDMSGRLIDVIQDADQKADTHAIGYDTSRLVPGLYLIKLTVNNKTQVAKLVIE